MSIQNYLNQIKSAVFGKDVRQSIHDAIKQCYDDASIDHDNANMEVKLARGSHDTLNERFTSVEENIKNNSEQLEHIEIKKAEKTEVNKKANEKDLEVERRRIDVLVSQGNGVDNAETADIRVAADGRKYNSAGNSVRETQRGNAILDDAISPRNLSIMKSVNLFNGQFLQGKYIGGNTVGNMTLKNDSNYYLVAIPIEKNTQYSIFIGNDIGKEDNYYWFKIATSTKTVLEVITESDSDTYSFDGSVGFANTTNYQAGQKITTGEDDKSLFILVSKYTAPSYVEVVKGGYSAKLYSEYDNSNKILSKFIPKSLVKKDGNEMTIYLKSKINENFVYIIFKRQTDTSVKLDTWRIYEIGICNNSFETISILQTNTDQEGAIEENGASDFIGGFHGDEYYNKIQIVIDGVVYSENDYIMLKEFSNIKIYVSSILNHCNTTNKAFDRVKILEFSNEGYYTVENNLTCASSFLIKRLATALFSIDKQYNSNNLIQYYNENLTNYPTIVPIVNDNSTTLVWDNSITEIELYGNGLYTKTSLLTEKLNGYMGMVQDFGGRIKAYLDPARNLQMNIGDKIKTKFKVEIRC
ncbi:MAG: hypothetical protein SPE36_08750 [Lactobacillus johnsonii]|nr:hypothetical protein [Lactobacillus johnsonii]